MKLIVYRLTYSSLFVYRETIFIVRKFLCNVEHFHKLSCGWYSRFYHPQNRFSYQSCGSPVYRGMNACRWFNKEDLA